MTTLQRALVLSFPLVITGGFALASGQGEAQTEQEPLEFWVRADEAMHNTYQELIDEFTAQTGIAVEKPVIAFTDFENALIRRASAGNLPDVVVNDTGFLGTLVNFGMVQEIDPAEIPNGDQIAERAWRAAQAADGRYYGVPINSQAFALFINRRWRERLGYEIPDSWDQIRALAVAFTEEDPDGNGRDDTVGFLYPGGTARGYATWNFHNILWSFGGNYMEPTGDGTFIPTFNTAEAAAALQWLKDMTFMYDAVNPNIATAVTGGDINPAFAGAQGGMIITGPYMIPTFVESLGTESFEVVPVPSGPGQDSAGVLAEGENAYVMQQTEQYDNAVAFAAFLASETGQRIGMRSGPNQIPFVRLPVNENVSMSGRDHLDVWEKFVPIYRDSAQYVPSVPSWFPFRLLISEYINEAIASEDSDIGDILDRADQAIADELESQGVLAR